MVFEPYNSNRRYPRVLKHPWYVCPFCFWMTITYRGKYKGVS